MSGAVKLGIVVPPAWWTTPARHFAAPTGPATPNSRSA